MTKTPLKTFSLLCPTRGRPTEIHRLYQSIIDTADKPEEIELVLYIDDDDRSYDGVEFNGKVSVQFVPGARIVLSQMWNECYKVSKGDILMHCGDDIVFRTKGWDTTVKDAFSQYPDKIVFVFGDDGHWKDTFGTHGFIHRKWAETVGHFVPPYFSSDYNDTWLNDVARAIGRHHYVDILTEHMHFAFSKGPLDQTHKDRLERHEQDNVNLMYEMKSEERQQDVDKLKEVIK